MVARAFRYHAASMPPAVLRSSVSRCVAAWVFVGVSLLASRAFAFERQWHLGGGVGGVALSDAYVSGGALSLHAAYGISDMFDVRLEERLSMHDSSEDADGAYFSLSTLGIAYKLDIIEWVPYLGVRAGYYHFTAEPAVELSSGGGAIGSTLGVDYAFSRGLALGAELTYDTLLPAGACSSFVLRAEYRWGY